MAVTFAFWMLGTLYTLDERGWHGWRPRRRDSREPITAGEPLVDGSREVALSDEMKETLCLARLLLTERAQVASVLGVLTRRVEDGISGVAPVKEAPAWPPGFTVAPWLESGNLAANGVPVLKEGVDEADAFDRAPVSAGSRPANRIPETGDGGSPAASAIDKPADGGSPELGLAAEAYLNRRRLAALEKLTVDSRRSVSCLFRPAPSFPRFGIGRWADPEPLATGDSFTEALDRLVTVVLGGEKRGELAPGEPTSIGLTPAESIDIPGRARLTPVDDGLRATD